MRLVGLALVLLTPAVVAQPSNRFVITSEFGAESEWTEGYLNEAWSALVRLMDNRQVQPPTGIQVSLKKAPGHGGIGGFATGRSIGFKSGAWPKEKHRLWILAHELVNLFAHHYGGAGGYPSDWWANGRSPFPEYVSCLVMKQTGFPKAAEFRRQVHRGQPDHDLFWKLHTRYGFGLFSRFFKLIRADGVDLGRIGAAWPRPDEVRSAYTIAYLSLAARTNLAGECRRHGIGKEPPDWAKRHPEIPFVAYDVSDEEVENIIAVREFLFARRQRGKGVELLRDLYRKGVTYVRSKSAAAPTPLESAPIRFSVTSDFGAESEWTRHFLTRAGAALVRVLGIADAKFPKRIPVRLEKRPGMGGIAGGAAGTSLHFVSDAWPEERFRHWLLCQELVLLITPYLGGNLPPDWFGHRAKPFAAYAAVLILEDLGRKDEAAWVRGMHRSRQDHELFWRLHEKHRASWAIRFFRLLEEDGIDIKKVGAAQEHPRQVCTLYVITYLSLATGSNLAGLCRSHGIGLEPPGWDDRHGPFREYRVTEKDVAHLMQVRGRLFAASADPGEVSRLRDRFRRGDPIP